MKKAIKKIKPISMKRIISRMQKHLQLTHEEVIEEAIRELYAFLFNE